MDKIELTVENIEALLKWRDEHNNEVRSHPAPLKAVEIVISHSGFRIKGIREGNTLRLHLSRNYEQFGNCTFVRRVDGMWASTKDRTKGVSKEDLQSALTVYCSLMALMAYGRMELAPEPESDVKEKPRRSQKSTNCVTRKSVKRTTYILRQVNGTLLAAPRGSHASPSGIFTVRGHYRHYKSGKVVWIAEYRKGTGKKKSKTYKMGGKTDG